MSAGRLPHREDLLKLLDIFETAPRPILIHCHGGADRTGEASAIYKLEYMAKTKKQALRQLTLWYMHLKPRFPAKRYFIKDLYQGKDWVKSDYKTWPVELKIMSWTNQVIESKDIRMYVANICKYYSGDVGLLQYAEFLEFWKGRCARIIVNVRT